MTHPRQPEDRPAPEDTPTQQPHQGSPNGVPAQSDGGEAKGMPHSDRAKTEEAAKDS